jgi:hypothetical protein
VATLVLFDTVGAAVVEVEGVKVSLGSDEGPAKLRAERLGDFRMRVDLDPAGAAGPFSLRILLPVTGRSAWPAADVVVRDGAGRALLVRRPGIEWENMLVPLPEGVWQVFVEAEPPAEGWPRATAERDRRIDDESSGLTVRIARWPGGREAALSIRFDDSHPSHLNTAIPVLDEYGFAGTFMVNPGPTEAGSRRTSDFDRQRAEWAAVAARGVHELANHTAHHRGAVGDEDMEGQVGIAARAIWELSPAKSKLTALNLGGGTSWETTRTLRHYLEKYHHFDASGGSLGMDDSYGGRVEAFRQALERHLERGLWCRIHYHSIGEGLASSEENLRAALDLAKEREERLWIAGMAAIHKYQTERDAAKLVPTDSGPRHLAFRIACGTDPELYDQSLTIEILAPAKEKSARIRAEDAAGSPIELVAARSGDGEILRFEVPAFDGLEFRLRVEDR